MVMCLATMAYVYAACNVQYVLLFLVLVVNSNQFQIYGVTHSYSSCTFLCALGKVDNLTPLCSSPLSLLATSKAVAGHESFQHYISMKWQQYGAWLFVWVTGLRVGMLASFWLLFPSPEVYHSNSLALFSLMYFGTWGPLMKPLLRPKK